MRESRHHDSELVLRSYSSRLQQPPSRGPLDRHGCHLVDASTVAEERMTLQKIQLIDQLFSNYIESSMFIDR
jgi:hypothetical protein